jgi:quercetin dioxygenase-like cupin family protein
MARMSARPNREEIMSQMGRRPALALGLAVAATPALTRGAAAQMQTPGSDQGEELAPGVRLVQFGKGPSIVPAYKSLSLFDVVFQPGSHLPQDTMKNDMVCHMAEGELRAVQNGKEFRFKKGDVWSCATGTTEEAWNEGSTVAVMRVIDLLTT